MGIEDLLYDPFADFDYRKESIENLEEQIRIYKDMKEDLKELKKKYRAAKFESFLDGCKRKALALYSHKEKVGFAVACMAFGGFLYATVPDYSDEPKKSALQAPVEEKRENAENKAVEEKSNGDKAKSAGSEYKTRSEQVSGNGGSDKNFDKSEPEISSKAKSNANDVEDSPEVKSTGFVKPEVSESSYDNAPVESKKAYESDEVKSDSKEYNYLSKPSDMVYFIVRGDTLSKISENVTGSMDNWRKLKAYNDLDSTLIEVNEILKIPGRLARNEGLLEDYRLVEEAEVFDGKHLPYEFVISGKNDSFRDISRKMFGTAQYAKEVIEYNEEINPRFSSRIYNKERIYKPPRGYIDENR
ncbi:MAG: LysM peptidoglycan-binding domain-containing protein [Candidatus Nanoarchaeia archaeon]